MKTLILSLVLFFTLSCNNNDDNQSATNVATPITPTLIGKGELFIPYNNINVQQNINISNQTDWNNFIAVLGNSGNPSFILSETVIDFNNFEIIAVFDNVKPTGGNSIDITSIIENVDNISVTIQRLQSGDATVVTQPYHIVKIPISTKPVVFQ